MSCTCLYIITLPKLIKTLSFISHEVCVQCVRIGHQTYKMTITITVRMYRGRKYVLFRVYGACIVYRGVINSRRDSVCEFCAFSKQDVISGIHRGAVGRGGHRESKLQYSNW